MATVEDVPLEWVRDPDLDIVYYGEEMNAPCCKVRMIMHMYGFRYTSIDGLKKKKNQVGRQAGSLVGWLVRD